MNKKLYLIAFGAFATGAAIGSLATAKYLKTKYEQLVQEEIESIKESFDRRKNELEQKAKPVEPTETEQQLWARLNREKPDMMEYANMLRKNGYSNDETTKGVVVMNDKPYVISPDEFGEFEEYETISLTYYADGHLADDMDDLVDDIEETVGYDSLEHFGEYEDEIVHVRNDKLCCDYEICLDNRSFADIIGKPSN